MFRALFLLALSPCLLPAADSPPAIPYLEQLVTTAENAFAKEVPDKTAWLANRDRYRRELGEMLGLLPEPPRGDLRATVTGTLNGDGITVEKLHFQSLPGLYVTANYYRPSTPAGKLPTILYLSGHGVEIGKDGRSNGNKTHYQHHGVWFAQHGYNCLILDTVQYGEILGEHWGTYKLNRWWWVSRGYTPAGVETWAGIRALDYLASRPDVDMEKIGVTGRSGGGAYSWFVAAMDDRVKVSAPTAGITTLRDHVIGGCIDGHCDCMYMVNLYGWDFDKLAALTAPRPLLISNTDKDTIFPLGGVLHIYESTRRLYKMLDAEKNIGLQISEGPHKDTQPLNAGAFHWFERFLKSRDPMAVIKEPAVPMFKNEDLRVFSEIPKDEINTRIDETFVRAFAPPPVPQSKEEWEKMKTNWMKVLSEKILSVKEEPKGDLSMMIVPGAELPMPVAQTLKLLQEMDQWPDHTLLLIGTGVSADYADHKSTASFPSWPDWPFLSFLPGCDPTNGTGLSGTLSTRLARRYQLCGASYDVLRCREVTRFTGRMQKSGHACTVRASGNDAAIALFASLMTEKPAPMEFDMLPSSIQAGPVFPAILKYMDLPHAVAMAAERCKVRITGRREDWTWPLQTAEKMGFAANLEIVPALVVLETKKIWDAAPHNAFTSLTKFKNAWYCTFREGSAHVPGTDGEVRVLTSKDGATWESAALLTEKGVDLRDPKFCSCEDGRLMLTMGGSFYDGTPSAGAHRKLTGARSRVSFSTDGIEWSAPQPACEEKEWLWRVTQRPHGLPYFENDPRGVPAMFYGISYPTNTPEAQAKLSLWESSDGIKYHRIPGVDPGRSLWLNETTVRFDEKGNMMALARSDRKGTNAFFGFSRPPFKEWSWTDTGHIIHGPDFIRLKDGRMFYAGRDFANGKANTTVGYLSPAGQAMPLVVLPSGGDCSYPGLAEGPDGQLFVSYYSSHEGKTSIYLSRLSMAK